MIWTILIVVLLAWAGVRAFNAHAARKQSFYGIWFIVGQIGSGKTTYLARLARKWNKAQGIVYSNVPIRGCYQLNVADLGNFAPVENSLVLIDESGIEFNSRNFKSTSKALIDFMKLSRHYKCRVVFCSQTFTDSDKQIRELATRVLFLRPMILGELSAFQDVVSRVQIDAEGQPSIQYEIKRFGGIYPLRPYRKDFNSFYRPELENIALNEWEFDDPPKKERKHLFKKKNSE